MISTFAYLKCEIQNNYDNKKTTNTFLRKTSHIETIDFAGCDLNFLPDIYISIFQT